MIFDKLIIRIVLTRISKTVSLQPFRIIISKVRSSDLARWPKGPVLLNTFCIERIFYVRLKVFPDSIWAGTNVWPPIKVPDLSEKDINMEYS